jgi:hypothetical protein
MLRAGETVNRKIGLNRVIDLSAAPFFLRGQPIPPRRSDRRKFLLEPTLPRRRVSLELAHGPVPLHTGLHHHPRFRGGLVDRELFPVRMR